MNTSNVTGRHRGPKRKLRAGYRAPSRVSCVPSVICLPIGWRSLQTHVIFFIVEYGIARFLCVVRKVRALCAYSTFGHHPHPRLPLWQTSSVAELTRGEKLRTQSINQPTYLMRREPKLSLRKCNKQIHSLHKNVINKIKHVAEMNSAHTVTIWQNTVLPKRWCAILHTSKQCYKLEFMISNVRYARV